MSSIPDAAWLVISAAVGALSQYAVAHTTNAATIAQQKRQADRDDVTMILAAKDAELLRALDALKVANERADRYLAQLLEDERTMHRTAEALEQTRPGGAP